MIESAKPGDEAAEGVVLALQLAGDPERLSNATAEQLATAAGFLTRARARVLDGGSQGARQNDAVARLESANKAIGKELAKRAFS